MAKSNAVKRLERILSDEEYGPKLARLNRVDERRVLDLIDENKGREARAEIIRLDKARLERRRTRSSKKPTSVIIDKNVLRRRAKENILRKTNGDPQHVGRNVTYMTDDELDFAVTAGYDAISERAKETAYYRPPDLDIDINPFWYHPW